MTFFMLQSVLLNVLKDVKLLNFTGRYCCVYHHFFFSCFLFHFVWFCVLLL